ncbi:MAG: metal ABC transporter solute-binding protein, Zn/Mn family [Alphaproteobacteria bacterium]
MKSLLVILLLLGTSTHAEIRVVTSIAPIQGLVTEVMAGIGTPELLLDSPTSSHHFALRPSQAHAIAEADVVFYVGMDMEPWLENALEASGGDLHISLGNLPSLNRLPSHDTDHAQFDPHMWLDSENTLLWLDIIAGILGVADPINKAVYLSNLEATRADIVAGTTATRVALASLSEVEIIVTHDSLEYLAAAFDLNIIGAFSDSEGQAAGARSVSRLLNTFGPQTCVVEDASHPSKIVANLPDGIAHVSLDPMGYDAIGADGYYSTLLSNITTSLLDCLK